MLLENNSISFWVEILPKQILIILRGVFLIKCEFLKSASLLTTTNPFLSAKVAMSSSEVFHLSKIRFTCLQYAHYFQGI